MPKLKVLSASEVIKIFEQFGFMVASQKGSHIKLKRVHAGNNQILTIPFHKELDRGTLRAIVRQATRYIPEAELTPHFYEEQ